MDSIARTICGDKISTRWYVVADGGEVFGIIAIILTIVVGAVAIIVDPAPGTGSGGSHDTYPLGAWANMPASSTCSSTDTTKPTCELFGNQSYRGVIRVVADVKYLVGLEVQCINPSNTVGAALQLQYANASAVTHTNTTKFVNAGGAGVGRIFIDNSVNWPCPGTLHSTVSAFALPIIQAGIQNTVFMFRVVGYAGGGTGDNPRFNNINVIVSTQLINQEIGYATSVTVNGFTALLAFNFVVTSGSGVTINFNWIASDGTTIQDGSNSCTISQGGVSCTVAITFTPAFVGTPSATVTSTDTPSPLTVFAGEINLLSTQTVTV